MPVLDEVPREPGRLPPTWRLAAFCSVPALLICAGTLGYHAIERWPWFDSLYVAATTLTSLGSANKYPASQAGRALTVALALLGVSTLAVAGAELLGAFVTGELRDFLRSRRMTRRIEALQRHVIVCGYGQVGQHVCARLLAGGVPVVAVDRRDGPLARARDAGALAVLGDAGLDETLRCAGIDRARALVAVAGNDPDNVVITMTARLLHPALPIVSCTDHQTSIPKLLRAGATRTASPHTIAGERIAEAVLRPSVATADLRLREELVRPGGPLDGKTVAGAGLRARGGPVLVAILRRDGQVAFDPADGIRLEAGDVVISVSHGPGPEGRGCAGRA